MNLSKLPIYSEKQLNVVVETPRGSRIKIAYDSEYGVFRYRRPLVLGVSYPYDWGFVPSTLAPDGDPLDAMIYHGGTGFPGLVVPCRAIGVVELSQAAEGKAERQRNDRLIVVPAHEERWTDATQFTRRIQEELEQFFLLATLMTDKEARIEGWKGPDAAGRLIEATGTTFRKKEKGLHGTDR
ncbi:inorganic diphosphatase [Pendulispora rubella]|uniref:inorganic diphosphatase n=1 Tax=Pendulispora rubella TaxID=2741070 RepID=A0ABZ2LFN6_9BACT